MHLALLNFTSEADTLWKVAVANPSESLSLENPLRVSVTTPSHRILFKPSALLRTDPDNGAAAEASVVMKCVASPFQGAGLPATALVIGGQSGAVEAVMVRFCGFWCLFLLDSNAAYLNHWQNVGKLNGPRTAYVGCLSRMKLLTANLRSESSGTACAMQLFGNQQARTMSTFYAPRIRLKRC